MSFKAVSLDVFSESYRTWCEESSVQFENSECGSDIKKINKAINENGFSIMEAQKGSFLPKVLGSKNPRENPKIFSSIQTEENPQFQSVQSNEQGKQTQQYIPQISFLSFAPQEQSSVKMSLFDETEQKRLKIQQHTLIQDQKSNEFNKINQVSKIEVKQEQQTADNSRPMLIEKMHMTLTEIHYPDTVKQFRQELIEFYQSLLKLVFHIQDYHLIWKLKQFFCKSSATRNYSPYKTFSEQFKILQVPSLQSKDSADSKGISCRSEFMKMRQLLISMWENKTKNPLQKGLEIFHLVNFTVCYIIRFFIEIFEPINPNDPQKNLRLKEKDSYCMVALIVDLVLMAAVELITTLFESEQKCVTIQNGIKIEKYLYQNFDWMREVDRVFRNAQNIISILSPSSVFILNKSLSTMVQHFIQTLLDK